MEPRLLSVDGGDIREVVDSDRLLRYAWRRLLLRNLMKLGLNGDATREKGGRTPPEGQVVGHGECVCVNFQVALRSNTV